MMTSMRKKYIRQVARLVSLYLAREYLDGRGRRADARLAKIDAAYAMVCAPRWAREADVIAAADECLAALTSWRQAGAARGV